MALCCSEALCCQPVIEMPSPRPSVPVLLLACLCAALLLGCATPYHSKPSFWNGQTGFSQTRLGPDKWQLEFVGNDLVSRETARMYVLKRAGEVAQAEGYQWLEVNELTLQRDAVRVTPSRPLFGFDDDEPDPFLDQRTVEHRISALLVFTLAKRARNDQSLKADYLANIKINSD
ncbi:CC0125/CC1285 family lipoprotein [Aeromonas dhakensis]|uniref:CC0125/CC1285 family lipoprotein n=1 Tax=Aeromonas dhakensis TaxID=196024 RepID=UPI003BA3DD75